MTFPGEAFPDAGDPEAEEAEESDGTQNTILDESEETEEATAEDIQCVFPFSFTRL